jgi:hypothetical protein
MFYQLGGAVVPHDGECHMDKKGSGGRYIESVAKTLDYPSVGQINHKVTLSKIIPIFAVVANYFRIYEVTQYKYTNK